MVTFQLRGNTHKIIDKITVPKQGLLAKTKWFTEDIEIKTSDGLLGGTIIYDFNFSTLSVIEISFNGDVDANYKPIADGAQIQGRQSRYLRVLDGDKINFRAVLAGDINRIVVGEV